MVNLIAKFTAKKSLVATAVMLLMFVLQPAAPAQTVQSTSALTVPRLVNFSGRATDAQNKPLPGVTGITFAIYRDQHDGAPLWIETQNIQTDKAGNYTAQLGATKREQLPLDLFSTNESRWLGVRVNGGEEQPRVLLLSVPYALKAADAETVGGLPASAFVLATPAVIGSNLPPTSATQAATPSTAPPPAAITGSGTLNFLPIWTGTSTQGNSALFQTGTGATAKVGINTTTPASPLDVNGGSTFRGPLNLVPMGNATGAAGKSSQFENISASSYDSSSAKAVQQNFRLQAEASGNNTTNASATLNVLFGSGTTTPAETGLKISSSGQITFAPGQTFPGGGSGSGTVTSVALSAPTSDFSVTGSPVTTSGTLGLGWKVAPASTNTANSIVKRDASGNFAAGSITATNITTSGTLAVSQLGVTGLLTAGQLALGNDGNVVISTDPGNDTTPDDVGYSLIGRGPGGVPNKWSIFTAPIGGGFGVPANSLSIWQYPPNQNPGCCLQRFVINPSTSADTDITTFQMDGSGNIATKQIDSTALNLDHAAAVYGHCGTTSCQGVYGRTDGEGGAGIYGYGFLGRAYAGYFSGNILVTGVVETPAHLTLIDDPLDPANKMLAHASVQSADMMNLYNGNAVLDGNGEAVVELPGWFESVNGDFRYQLTSIGAQSSPYVAEEISGNQFKIAGGRPNGKVSWQVTGIRRDAYANAHRMQVEQPKKENERGFYLNPEAFGAGDEKSIDSLHRPETLPKIREKQAKLTATKIQPAK